VPAIGPAITVKLAPSAKLVPSIAVESAIVARIIHRPPAATHDPALRRLPYNRGLPKEKKVFSYEEASVLLPEVRQATEEAYRRVESLAASSGRGAQAEADAIVQAWARELAARGLEIKGLWLVDFDNGSGYYCWRYPEERLEFYHSYEEGFGGRMRIQ
jgi:hypothetical protein